MAPLKDLSPDRLYKRLFVLLCLAFLAVILYAQKDFGITWDERMQGHYGKLVLRYFYSGGTNQDFLNFTDTMHFYGGLFDALTGTVYSLLFDSFPNFVRGELHDTLKGLSRQDLWGSGYYETRHVINALTGFLAIVFTGLAARTLGSWRTGCLAFLLLVLTPPFLGHSINNPKDIPFATAYIASLYFILRLIREFPKIRISTSAWTALAIAAAINMRIGGILILFLLGLFTGSGWLLAWHRGEPHPPLLRLLGAMVLITAAGYFGGLLAWPYGLMDPLRNPLRALQSMSHFIGAEGKLLFEGKMLLTSGLPWYYIPKWILISCPIAFPSGLLMLALFTAARRPPLALRFMGMLAFAAIFPWAYAVFKGAILYDSWRHFLFIYPPLVILAAAGWEALLEASGKRKFFYLTTALWLLCMAEPAIWMIRNHPYYSVYFNKLVGGLPNAQYNYETDYWGNSVREASEWIGHYHLKHHPDEMAIVGSNASYSSSFQFLRAILGDRYLPYDPLPPNLKAKYRMNYYIVITRGVKKKDLMNGGWPPPRTIYEVKADGVTLCAVVDLHEPAAEPPKMS